MAGGADEPGYWLSEAIRLHNSGQYGLARKHYKKYLAEHPNDPDALANYAACEYCVQNHSKASKFAKLALAVDPEHPHGLKILALSEAGNHRVKQALNICDTITSLAPEDSDSFKFRSEVEMELGLPVRAEDSIRTALQLSPDDESLHRALGNIELIQGKAVAAELSARRALALDPENKESLALLGHIQRYNGQTTESTASMLSALRVDPHDFENRTRLLNARRSAFPPYRWLLNAAIRSASILAKALMILGMVLAIGLRVLFSEYQRSHGTFQAVIMGGNAIIVMGTLVVVPQLIDAFLLRSPSYALYFSPTQRLATRMVAVSVLIAVLLPVILSTWQLAPLGRWVILLFGTTIGGGINSLSAGKWAARVTCLLVTISVIAALVIALNGGKTIQY